MYFDSMFSAKSSYGSHTEPILEALIQRFIGSNPELPYCPVLDMPTSFSYDDKGGCNCVLDNQFANLPVGGQVVASTYWPCENDRDATMMLKCYGPTKVYVNGERVFISEPYQENYRIETGIPLLLNKGMNLVSFVTEKTTIGLGFRIRTGLPQWDPVHYFQKSDTFLPLMGFNCSVYSDESDLLESNIPTANLIPVNVHSESDETYLVKVPVPASVTSFTYNGAGSLSVISGEKIEKNKVVKIDNDMDWLDFVYRGKQLSADFGEFNWNSTDDVNWLYCGPVDFSDNLSVEFSKLQKNTVGESIYWQAPYEGVHVRMMRRSNLYAHWTYWMGVTLYGFLEAGEFFNKPEWQAYALSSLKQITDFDQYSQWDKAQYHYPMINTQLYWLNELDDCGSFGNFMLESLNYRDNDEARPIANRIADFMKNHMLRQSDGAFYRENETMWVDDLYMSTPFLTRYWSLTGEDSYLEEAINQFYLFKKRLFMEDKQLMSHIYDTKFQQPNRIPWSRGNGWVVFSLSELLNKMPETHPKREGLVTFYNQMMAGIIAQQDKSGLWHQVLDDETTYIESSCTAMFICALSRGIRNHYISDGLYDEAIVTVKKAWDGLITNCVDKDGNLYGVCRGSGHSFSRDYYHGLGWLLNDPHGTGIVALAGVEYEKLMAEQEIVQ